MYEEGEVADLLEQMLSWGWLQGQDDFWLKGNLLTLVKPVAKLPFFPDLSLDI